MNLVKLFLDTADVDYCKSVWEAFSKRASGKELVGVTTNPNAMYKISANTLLDMEKAVRNLCSFVTEVRNDDNGVVYVQVPSSNMLIEDAKKYINLVKTFTDGKTKIAIKIPPKYEYLNLANELNDEIDFNVTGLAEFGTALKCLSFPVRYVSIIPGRMEEKGFDANSHLKFLASRNKSKGEVIAGSMRTLEGLKNSVLYHTVPTIGWRVLDQIVEDNLVEEVLNYWEQKEDFISNENAPFAPTICDGMTELSIDFFKQMDELGAPLFNDFQSINK